MQSGTAPEALKDPETLVASIMDLFSAGSDTTATTIGWVLQALAKYPKIQERLRSEILRVVGSKGIPEPSDLAKMPYLHAVVFEAMRFRSLVPIGVEHCTTQDITIGGYRVPANSTVFVNQKAIHEDPRYWKDVTSFNPDNFLTADGEIHVPQQFMPFGWGSRVCIGQPLAKMELLVFLTRILQGLKISPVPSKPVTLESVGDIVLRPADLELLFEPFQ